MTGKATQEAIQAMQTAVMVACIMPAIVASTTAGHQAFLQRPAGS